MTSKETGKLFNLLEQFFPNAKLSDNKRLAWEMALAPYQYEDVKAAAIAYVRANKFFPDLADLTAGLKIETAMCDPVTMTRWVRKAIERWGNKPINHVTHYAAEHGCTVGEAEKALGMTWEEARA